MAKFRADASMRSLKDRYVFSSLHLRGRDDYELGLCSENRDYVVLREVLE